MRPSKHLQLSFHNLGAFGLSLSVQIWQWIPAHPNFGFTVLDFLKQELKDTFKKCSCTWEISWIGREPHFTAPHRNVDHLGVTNESITELHCPSSFHTTPYLYIFYNYSTQGSWIYASHWIAPHRTTRLPRATQVHWNEWTCSHSTTLSVHSKTLILKVFLLRF